MADRRRCPGPLPPTGRHATASAPAPGRVDRGAGAVVESARARRLRARRVLAGWGAARRPALSPGGPYPLLAISGEQGSAKTVLSKMLRSLVDPGVAPVRALPREERELFIAAHNGHVLAFDNLTA